ncbi:hypothetical protein ABZ805_28455 [Saccharopolyspora sp. NPDC047091]|uniref:hypothetical protein n=1 Tax=Saccharopolyspora sp. NPDC047091 TaxID=3155924 RepID=UPI0033EF4E6D
MAEPDTADLPAVAQGHQLGRLIVEADHLFRWDPRRAAHRGGVDDLQTVEAQRPRVGRHFGAQYRRVLRGARTARPGRWWRRSC